MSCFFNSVSFRGWNRTISFPFPVLHLSWSYAYVPLWTKTTAFLQSVESIQVPSNRVATEFSLLLFSRYLFALKNWQIYVVVTMELLMGSAGQTLLFEGGWRNVKSLPSRLPGRLKYRKKNYGSQKQWIEILLRIVFFNIKVWNYTTLSQNDETWCLNVLRKSFYQPSSLASIGHNAWVEPKNIFSIHQTNKLACKS